MRITEKVVKILSLKEDTSQRKTPLPPPNFSLVGLELTLSGWEKRTCPASGHRLTHPHDHAQETLGWQGPDGFWSPKELLFSWWTRATPPRLSPVAHILRLEPTSTFTAHSQSSTLSFKASTGLPVWHIGLLSPFPSFLKSHQKQRKKLSFKSCVWPSRTCLYVICVFCLPMAL